MPLDRQAIVDVEREVSARLVQPKSLPAGVSYNKVRPACSEVIGAIRNTDERGNPAALYDIGSPLYKLFSHAQDFCVGVPVDSLQNGTFKSEDLEQGVLAGKAAVPEDDSHRPLRLYENVVHDVARDAHDRFVVDGDPVADEEDHSNERKQMVMINSSDWQAQAERVFCAYDASWDEKQVSEILMARIKRMRKESPQCGDTTLTGDECELLANKMAVAGPSRVYIGDNGEVLRHAKLNVAFHNTTPRLDNPASPHAARLCTKVKGSNRLQFNGNDGAMQYALEFGNSVVQICEGMHYMCNKGDIKCDDGLELVPTNVIFMPKAYLSALARDRNFYNSKNPAPSMCRNAGNPNQAAVMAATCGVLFAALVGYVSHGRQPEQISICVNPEEYGLTKEEISHWMRYESWDALEPACKFWGVEQGEYLAEVLGNIRLVDGRKYAGDVGQAYEDALRKKGAINIHSVPLNASPLHYGGGVMHGDSAKFASEENSNRKAFGQPIAAHAPDQNACHPCNDFLDNKVAPDPEKLAPGFLPVNLLTSILAIKNGRFHVNEEYTAEYLQTSCANAHSGRKTAAPRINKGVAALHSAADHDTMQRRPASNAGTLSGHLPRPNGAHSGGKAAASSSPGHSLPRPGHKADKPSTFRMAGHIFSHSDSPGTKARTFGFMCLFVLTLGFLGRGNIEREYNDVQQKQRHDGDGRGHRESGGKSRGSRGKHHQQGGQHQRSSVLDDSHSEQHHGKRHSHGRGPHRQ